MIGTRLRTAHARRSAPLALAAPLLCCLTTAAQPATQSTPTTQPADSPEQRQWQQVQQARELPPKSEPYAAWFAAARQQRQELLDAVATYLVLYPGGRHRDEAIRLQLSTLFELATLGGQSLDALEAVVDRYLESPPSPAAKAEAAYWKIVCEREVKQPPPIAVADDPELAADYNRYIREYPESRHTPRLAMLLFERAADRGDTATLRRLVRHMDTHFPDHATTALLTARLARRERVGDRAVLSGATLAGETFSTATYNGHPTVFVFWAGYDATSRACVRAIEAYRRAHPDVRVAGMVLDESATDARVAVTELQLPWPQLFDRLTWGARLVRNWGIHRVPTVLVFDEEGRFRGSATCDRWTTWQALLEGDTTARPPARRPTSRPQD